MADLTLDTETLTVQRAGTVVPLNPARLRILELLLCASPRVVSREEIERAIYGDSPTESDALRTHVSALRQSMDRSFGVYRTALHGAGAFRPGPAGGAGHPLPAGHCACGCIWHLERRAHGWAARGVSYQAS